VKLSGSPSQLLLQIAPSLIAWWFWNDFIGGLYVAGIFRLTLLHHSTFCISSLAHALGEQSFDDKLTPRDSVIVAFLTFGEGYHKYALRRCLISAFNNRSYC
jgi:stearoyl-CoA desaturase (delta-9 desaturase)